MPPAWLECLVVIPGMDRDTADDIAKLILGTVEPSRDADADTEENDEPGNDT